MPTTKPGAEDEQRRRDLRNHKRLSVGLLVAMAGVYLATRLVHEPEFWTLLVRAGSEAGIVGGLADWFAVTALFRHPLGVPIPHTALIPNNKTRIGENLGNFIARHFLSERVVLEKLRELDVAKRLGHWLADARNAEFFTDYAFTALPYVLDSLNDDEVRGLLGRSAKEQIERTELAPVLARLLSQILRGGHHQAIFDRALGFVRDSLVRNRGHIRQLVKEQSRWWVPPAVNWEVARQTATGLIDWLDELADDKHEMRRRFDKAAADWIEEIASSPASRAKMEDLKTRLLADEEIQGFLLDAGDELRRLMMDQVKSPSPALRGLVSHGLMDIGRRVVEDETVRVRANQRIESLVVHVVLPWRGQIGAFIADVVRQWDSDTLVDQIELVVGRDLQFIRVNGTLVGCLVGCALFLGTHALLP